MEKECGTEAVITMLEALIKNINEAQIDDKLKHPLLPPLNKKLEYFNIPKKNKQAREKFLETCDDYFDNKK